jgi:hypothetical protein
LTESKYVCRLPHFQFPYASRKRLGKKGLTLQPFAKKGMARPQDGLTRLVLREKERRGRLTI